MEKYNIMDTLGTEFPAGRRTRVIVGPNAFVTAENFVMGHVTINPGGSVPIHSHEQEEVYLILSGQGDFLLDEQVVPIGSGDYVYIKPYSTHRLRNTSDFEMKMLFCYAPKGIVTHWKTELQEGIK